jgi:hypothetical protein
MGITAEQLQMAGLIDARVKAITRSGVDDFAIFTEMADYMPAFKRLMDTSTDDDMDQLAARYTGLFDSRTSARPLQSPFPRQPEQWPELRSSWLPTLLHPPSPPPHSKNQR